MPWLWSLCEFVIAVLSVVPTVFFLLQKQVAVPFAGSTKLFGLAMQRAPFGGLQRAPFGGLYEMKSCGYTTRPFRERRSNVDYEDGMLCTVACP
jgi:hypothetical protein